MTDYIIDTLLRRDFASFWVGDHRAPFLLPGSASVRAALSLQDVVHGLSAPVGCGRRKPCETALTLTDGADFRCPIGLPRIGAVRELMEVLEYGTVFMNTASLHWKSLAQACLAASSVLHFPTNINVYVTGPGRRVSTDVHTDNHDVLILQTEGAKHWLVYPPPRRRSGAAHPLYRGKGEDHLQPEELGAPLLDVVLQPGEVLFVPMGFPHATSTADAACHGEAPSVHLTLGISAADYDFCFGGLCRGLLERLDEAEGLDEASLPDAAFWDLWSPVPVGSLLPDEVFAAPDPGASHLRHVASRLLRILAATAGPRWQGRDAEQLGALAERVVASQLEKQLTVLASQEEAYIEVAAAEDGIFLASGPEETASSHRRSMLEHQARDDERKRQRPRPQESAVSLLDSLSLSLARKVKGSGLERIGVGVSTVGRALREAHRSCRRCGTHAARAARPPRPSSVSRHSESRYDDV